MHVYDATVRYARKIQPQEYQPVEGDITLKATFTEDEDWASGVEDLMAQCREKVHAGLKGTAGKITDEAETKVEKKTTKKADKADKPKKETAAQKKKREAAEAKAKTERAAKDAALIPEEDKPAETKKSAADIPDDDDDAPQIRTNPEDRKEVVDDIPDESEVAKEVDVSEEGMSAEDLHEFITELVTNKAMEAAAIKEILAAHGAARIGDVKPEDRETIKREIEAASL